MSNIGKMTAWMRAQVGTREQGENNVWYNTIYYGREVSGPQYPWCAAFIWCGFRETGLSPLFLNGGKSAYCPYIVDWARQHGQWVTRDYREGDLLLYDWNRDGVADHIGYCLSWDGAAAVTIEGNVGGAVAQLRRSRDSGILGAYRIDYGRGDDTQPIRIKALPLLKRGSTGEGVKALQYMLLLRGLKLQRYGADGDFGEETERAVKEFQTARGLEADGEVGLLTWSALGRE